MTISPPLRTLSTAALLVLLAAPARAQSTESADAPSKRTWNIVAGSLLGGGVAVGTVGGILFFRDTKMQPLRLWTSLGLFAGGVGAAFTGGWMLAFPPAETAAPQGAMLVRTLRF